jgi:uncharacterized protein (TIGR03118 family)
MLFSSWLRNSKRSAHSARRSTHKSPRQRASFGPRLETLEDRVVLSATAIVQTNLVSDNTQFTPAQVQDPNLVNPWGLAASPTGDWWVANEGTGTSTLYDTSTSPASVNSLVVNIPANPSASLLAVPNSPTGTVYNTSGTGFDVSETVNGVTTKGSSAFLFATVDGTISGWSPSVDRTHAIVGATSSGAAYTGLAIATDSQGDTLLYAANFAGGIDVYNSNFQLVTTLAGSFTDPQLPSGYTPFNIQAINNQLYVEYAPVGKVLAGTAGAGDGAVDVYNADGQLQQRLLLPGNTHLNDPWAVAMAPSNFGGFSNDLLVGDFGNGHIEAFNPTNGDFVGELQNADGQPIAITHLWALAFGNGGAAGPTNTLYFTAGLTSHLAPSNNPFHGLFGSLQVAPAPGPSVEGNALWLVGGDHTNDQVDIEPVGSSNTGSTGIRVRGQLDGVDLNKLYNPAPSMIYLVGFNGNENIHEAKTLTISTNVNEGSGNDDIRLGSGDNTVVAGSGNDYVRLGNGNDAIALGNGNDNVQAGNGNNVVTAGNGNDNVRLGNGNNLVTLGNGNDNVRVGNGNNVVVAGSGNNNIRAGNGDNLIVGGLGGHNNIQAGNGNNILIDGSVSQSTAELLAVLEDWMSDIAAGDSAATIASDLGQSLTVDFNTQNANTLHAGSGLDWFWAAYADDHTNRKSTDLLN